MRGLNNGNGNRKDSGNGNGLPQMTQITAKTGERQTAKMAADKAHQQGTSPNDSRGERQS
jgi:hypothetical protein